MLLIEPLRHLYENTLKLYPSFDCKMIVGKGKQKQNEKKNLLSQY